MRVVQCAGHRPADPDRVGDRQPWLPVQPLPQRLPGDERHDVVKEAGALAGVVERDDLGMGEAGRDAHLAQEPLGQPAAGQLRAEDLDRHRAPVAEVLGDEDRRHAAARQLAIDAVAVGESGAEGIDHRRPAVRVEGTEVTNIDGFAG